MGISVVPKATLLLLLLFSLSNTAVNGLAKGSDNEALEKALTKLWQLDTQNREQFRLKYLIKSGEDNGVGWSIERRLNANHDTNPMMTAYADLCDHFRLDAATTSMHESVDQFIRTLNSTRAFQEVAHVLDDETNVAASTNGHLLSAIRALWFSPVQSPSFNTAFCHFSPDTGNWLSFMRDQSLLEQLEILNGGGNADEDDCEDLLLRIALRDGSARKRRILLGTSPEFELLTTSLCTLMNKKERGWKHCSAPIDNARTLLLTLKARKTVTANGEELDKVDAYFMRISPHEPVSKRQQKQKKKKEEPSSDPEMTALVEQLWAKDVDRVEPGTITLNWQGKLRKNQVEDISKDPLFTSVNESFLQRPIYAALVELYNAKVFHQQVCVEEPPMDAERREKFANLWGLITGSEVFKMAYEFLEKKGKTGGHDFDKFCDKMFDFWLGTYTRCKSRKRSTTANDHSPWGSSGFEHVFSGEWRQEIVDGHHNWIRYYLLEKAGDINYHGYFGYQQPDEVIGTFQYKWNGYLKKIGGFFFQTSPAFDFSLFTVCMLVHPGDEKCQYTLLDTDMFVTSFEQQCHNGTCIATTYPGTWLDQDSTTSSAPSSSVGRFHGINCNNIIISSNWLLLHCLCSSIVISMEWVNKIV